MTSELKVVVGVSLIVLNLIPFVMKKSKYILVTSIISLIVLFLLDKI